MKIRALAITTIALVASTGAATAAQAQADTTRYSHMAPVEQYLMDRDAEIALARTAAPASISNDAGVMILGRHGYETAAKSRNGFMCYVGRGWAAAADPDFWNPNVRVPMCLNAAATRSYFRLVEKITELGLAGRTLQQVNTEVASAVKHHRLPRMAPGSLGYMMGREGNGGDVAPHWPSHVMFFRSDVDPASWGANLAGSPIIAIADPSLHLTQFVMTVAKWADGTDATPPADHEHH